MSTRRNPSLAGTAGITVADLDALDQGRTTLQGLADKLGCSKQAISRKVRAMRSAAPTSPTTTATGPSIPAGSVAVDPAEIATSACLGLLVRAHAALIGPDQLGPSALKALSTTISTATAELRLLSVLDTGDDDAGLSTLTVRVMTDEEHKATKFRVGQPDADDFED